MSSITEQISRIDSRLSITLTTEVYPEQLLVQCSNGDGRTENYWFDKNGKNLTPSYLRE